jgi:hypothetical protein
MIYGYMFDDDTMIGRNNDSEPTQDDWDQLPAWYGLIQACRRLHQETSLMPFTTTTFVFRDLEIYLEFRLKLTKVQRDLMTKIRIHPTPSISREIHWMPRGGNAFMKSWRSE